MKAEPLVRIKNLSIKYHTLEGEISALQDISLDVKEGEFISIVGPSGCGKSTLLKALAGLLEPTGYMPQSDQLYQWRTIWKNVLLGLEVQNKVTPETKDYAAGLLEKYGLKEFMHARPNQLSGGMRQRVALIRTLAINPEILLLDEAFSALDYQTRLLVADEVKQIIDEEHKTAILVTHDIAEAISMADRVVVLTRRPGRIKSIHTIELTCSVKAAIKCREAPEFRQDIHQIWKELDIKDA